MKLYATRDGGPSDEIKIDGMSEAVREFYATVIIPDNPVAEIEPGIEAAIHEIERRNAPE